LPASSGFHSPMSGRRSPPRAEPGSPGADGRGGFGCAPIANSFAGALTQPQGMVKMVHSGRSCKFGSRSSHAKRLHRRAAPISNEVVTEFQSDSARTDSQVRVLHAQPASPVSVRHVRAAKIGATSHQNASVDFAVSGPTNENPSDRREGFCCLCVRKDQPTIGRRISGARPGSCPRRWCAA
jgi:hypothetical protein